MGDITAEMGRLREISRHDLLIEWQRLHRFEAPRHASLDFLMRGIVYKLQEQAHGGLTQAMRRRLRTLVEVRGEEGDRPRARAPLSPGVRLMREWHGRTHSVLVVEAGFDYQGQTYRSLSEIARVITGAHWSGPRFFGLNRRASAGDLDVAA